VGAFRAHGHGGNGQMEGGFLDCSPFLFLLFPFLFHFFQRVS
jgi:hypothetical protein